MSHNRVKAVNTQMGGAFGGSGKEGVAHVGNYKPVIKMDLGEKPAKSMTPTQTAGANTRPPRSGTAQHRYGKNST